MRCEHALFIVTDGPRRFEVLFDLVDRLAHVEQIKPENHRSPRVPFKTASPMAAEQLVADAFPRS
jgi:hypothetical protein